jgi:hypothetical protein
MYIQNLIFKHQKTIDASTNPIFPDGVHVMVIGKAGIVSVVTVGGEYQQWDLQLKEVFPILVKQILDAQTTATGITVLFNDDI